MKPSRLLSILLALTLLSINLTFAADDIHYQDIKSLKNIIPQQDSYYTISSNVQIDNIYYTFTITTPESADLQITSIPSLIKTIHELSVIEWYKSTPQGNQVWAGAKGSVKNIGKGAKAVVLHPGDSAVAIGRSVAKTGRAIGSFFKGLVKKEPKSSSGKDLDKGAGNILTADVARKAAYDLHLDVYSKNPLVIALLNEISKQQWAGSIGVSAATYFTMPGLSSATAITTGALTPGAVIDITERMIRDNSPEELNRELQRVMREIIGYSKDTQEYQLFTDFLNNPNFDPRQKAYITLYLTQLKHVAGMSNVLSVLKNCREIENAVILYHQLQLMAAVDMNAKNVKFSQYATNTNRIYGIISSGDLIAILPFDYATSSKFMKNELDMIPEVKGTRSIWLLGDATKSFSALAKKSGIDAIYDGILKFGAFKLGATDLKSDDM